MKYEVVSKSVKYYYKGEDGNLYGEGYPYATDFTPNGLAIVRKEAKGKEYYINEKFEIVSEGYKLAYSFESNGLAMVLKEDGKYYYINEKFETVSEGYRRTRNFSSNGLAVVEKADGKYYYINEKCETISEGYKDATGFNEEGLASVQKANGKWYIINDKFELVGSFDSEWNRKSEEEFRFDLYLDGELEVYDLPDEFFAGEYLDKLIENEKKVYEYLINMASTKDQMKKVKSDCVAKSDYIKGRAYEIDREKNKEKYQETEMERAAYLNEKNLF
jgi:hypothetical protein